ncbi:hypothetical protein SAMN05421755_10824 [Nitrosomonas sp. Nm33]|nr:hypothetical protein SAMN05421755_10824 [Nitrosomonas sp. Nm33]
MLNFVEETLNQMTRFINEPIIISYIDSIATRRSLSFVSFEMYPLHSELLYSTRAHMLHVDLIERSIAFLPFPLTTFPILKEAILPESSTHSRGFGCFQQFSCQH